MSWLTSPWMGPVGIAVGVVLTLSVAYLQRKPKRLDYQIIDDIRILSDIGSRLGGHLKVSYSGHDVASPRVMTVRVQNTGKRAVKGSDYDRPITFPVPNSARVVSISGSRPRGIASLVWPEDRDDYCTVRPELLNPGDYFDVQYVIDGESLADDFRASARFADQSRGMRRKFVRARVPGFPLLLIGMMIGVAGLNIQIALGMTKASTAVGLILLAIAFVASLGYGLWYEQKQRER